MSEFEFFVYSYGTQVLSVILCAICGIVGFGLKAVLRKHLDSEEKIAVAKIAAKFVEQVWITLHGPEKLQKALETAQELLSAKGIDFDAREMEILIEAAVAEFNDAFSKPKEAEEEIKIDGFCDLSDSAYSEGVDAGTM